MTSIRPAQVRTRILHEHAVLRAQLEQLEAEVELLDESSAGLAHVLELTQSLYRDMRDHIDYEEQLLVPALREADAWGPLRARELCEHHVLQRVQLRALAERCSSESPAALAQIVRRLIADIRADMTYEDDTLLSSELLHDDVVQVDAECG